jgi:hypothetical protein
MAQAMVSGAVSLWARALSTGKLRRQRATPASLINVVVQVLDASEPQLVELKLGDREANADAIELTHVGKAGLSTTGVLESCGPVLVGSKAEQDPKS